MKITGIVPAKQWRNTKTGATASIYGAAPYTSDQDRENWQIEQIGFTYEHSNGTVGNGHRPPFKTYQSALDFALEKGWLRPLVAKPDRNWCISINDSLWSSSEACAKSLLPVVRAQIGTAGTDRKLWAERVVLGTCRRVLPMALRAAADAQLDDDCRESLTEHADACAAATTLDEALATARAAANAARAVRADAKAARASRAVADAAAAYATAAADAAAYAARAANVTAAVYAAADATDYAARAADAAIRDKILNEAVSVALDAYRAEERH